jgi:flavin-binding protein dodecin
LGNFLEVSGQSAVQWKSTNNVGSEEGVRMAESVYKVIELVGSSPDSWEKAAKNAVDTASKSLKDIRIAEVSQLDMKLEEGKFVAFRARVKVSFKYLGKE